jgi:hypothetical protein
LPPSLELIDAVMGRKVIVEVIGNW